MVLAAPSEAPVPAAELLPRTAALLDALLDAPGSVAGRWLAPAFAREVELVRSHLRPILTPEALATSFAREAMHDVPIPLDRVLTSSAVWVAYAIRWLELADDRHRPGWRALLDRAGPAGTGARTPGAGQS